MNTELEVDVDPSEDAGEETELTAEELEQVVGGLDHGWWPNTDDFSGPQGGF